MLPKIGRYGRDTFSSLGIYNYRLYYIGQGISLSGTWLQTIAQTWLVLQLTHSATAIGLLAAVQFLPLLVLGPLGGVISDRFNKRSLLYVTQITSLLLALILGVLVYTHTVEIWMVFVLSGLLGLVKVVDNPARQTFIIEMVGPRRLKNAVALNSVEMNMARVVGPMLAAILIAGLGIAECFFINAASYVAVLVCLALMHKDELRPAKSVRKIRGQVSSGFRYVKDVSEFRTILLMAAVIGTLSYEFAVVLPVLASRTFHGNAGSFAMLTAAMGIGSVVGGVITAGRKSSPPSLITGSACMFGLFMLLVAIAPTIELASILLFFVGAWFISFTSAANSTLQLESAPEMRGRVMAMWSMAIMGSTPIGGPIIGWISEQTSPRMGLVVGGVAAISAAAFGAAAAWRLARAPKPTHELVPLPVVPGDEVR